MRTLQKSTIFVAIIIAVAFPSALAPSEAFIITEHTDYGITENIVYVTIKENLGKPQIINISNVFKNDPLTEQISYKDVLLNQSYSAPVYGWVNSTAQIKSKNQTFWNETQIIYDNLTNTTSYVNVTMNKTNYLDALFNILICDSITPDEKTCNKKTWAFKGNETKYDYLPIPELNEKVVISGLKIEQKQEGIPLPKNSEVQVKYTVKHPTAFGVKPSDDVNKYDITVCSLSGECSTLDPIWWNTSWQYSYNNARPNATTPYQYSLNISNNTAPFGNTTHLNVRCYQVNCTDLRFVRDNTTLEPYWRETNTSINGSGYATFWFNVTANGTGFQIYTGATGVPDASNGTNTFLQYHGTASANYLDPLVVSVPFVYETKSRITSPPTSRMEFGVSSTQSGLTNSIHYVLQTNDRTYYENYASGVTTYGSTLPIWTQNQWYRVKYIAKSSTAVDYYGYDTNTLSATVGGVPTATMGLTLNFPSSTGEQEFSFVRKYASPEPAWATWGQAESQSVTYIPPVPTITGNTTFNFGVNRTWQAGSGNITDAFNVSRNGTWSNSTITFLNTTASAHGWVNDTIYAYNSSGGGTLSSPAIVNTQIPNNPIIISGVSGSYSLNEGQSLSIDANYTDADSDVDVGVFTTNATKGSINSATGIYTLNAIDGDQGTYNWNISVTDNNGSTSIANFTVIVSDSTPTTISNLQNTTFNFGINWTWNAGNNADDYDIQINSTDIGYDNTTRYYNATYSAHATRIISIRSHNHTLDSYSAWTNQTTTIPNNIPVLNVIGNKNVNEGEWLNFTISGTDADSDSLSCSTNATKGTLSSCNFNWSIPYTDSGAYYWNFNVSDSYGGVDDENVTVTVNNIPLNISSFLPVSDPSSIQGTSQAFNVTLNRTANVTWYMNGTQMQANQSVTIANYTNATAGIGTWNVTATATDVDTVTKQWNWTINSANLVNFTFTNQSISESQIYQSSQATQINVDVNDSDGFLTNVSVGITYNGFETNYSMAGGNDTWRYSFKSGVAGSYTITHFYATDNASGTNSTTSILSFVVVPGLTGGTPPTATAAPTPATPIEKLQTKITTTLPQEIGTAKSGIEAIQQAINTIEGQPFERKAIAGIFILLIFMYSENMLWDRHRKR